MTTWTTLVLGWLALNGCTRDCATEVPADAIVALGAPPVQPEDHVYVCPETGASVASEDTVVYVDEEARVTINSTDSEVYAAAGSEVTVHGRFVHVVAHPNAVVEILGEGSTVENCQVSLEVPERLQKICRGEPTTPTGDTGGAGTTTPTPTPTTLPTPTTPPTGGTGYYREGGSGGL